MSVINRLAIIGAGVMGEALAAGLIRSGKLMPSQIVMTDTRGPRLEELCDRYGVATSSDNNLAVRDSDLVLLAVKPPIVAPVLAEIAPSLSPGAVVCSIAAGISVQAMEDRLPSSVRVVRAMPNSPCQVGAGVVALTAGRGADAALKGLLSDLLDCVGLVTWVNEDLMEAVTGLSGSGPAYVYLIIEALADGGVKCGLPREVAQRLAAQTVRGAAEMVQQSGSHPAVLREQVATPGGTTIAGLFTLEKGAVRASVMEAVEASARRSREIAERLSGKEC